MNNKEILTKAIQLAAGFDISIPHFAHPLEEYEWEDNKHYWYLGDITIPLFEIIYQHSFAKALWGEEDTQLWFDDEELYYKDQPLLGGEVSYPYNEGAAVGFKTKSWQYHLQMMVISDDPIAYLGANLPTEGE